VNSEIQNIRDDDCRLCDGKLHLITEPVSVRIGERAVMVNHTHRKCDKCGEALYTPQELRGLHREAAGVLRAESGLMRPEEIRGLRERLRMTQTELEEIMHAGKKSVVRWESGSVCQSGAADTLLRVFSMFPDIAEVLRGSRQGHATVFGPPIVAVAALSHVTPPFMPRGDIIPLGPRLALNEIKRAEEEWRKKSTPMQPLEVQG
jgi:putative zinc finger/helix-turn-helix YgiT family protein